MKKSTPRRRNKTNRLKAKRMAKNRKANLRTGGKLRKKRNGRLGY